MRQSVFILWLFIFVSAAHSQLFAGEGQQAEENTIETEINDTGSEIEILATLRVVDIHNAYNITFADDEREYIGLMPYEEAERSGIFDWPEDGSRTVEIAWHQEQGAGLVVPETGEFYKAYLHQKDAINLKRNKCYMNTETQDDVVKCNLQAVEHWKREYTYYYNLTLSKASNDKLKKEIIAADTAAKSYAKSMDDAYISAAVEFIGTMRGVQISMHRSGMVRQQLWLLLPLFELITLYQY